MRFILHPWQLLLVILVGWDNQQQQQIIDFQRTEIEVLKEKLAFPQACVLSEVLWPPPALRSGGFRALNLKNSPVRRKTTCASAPKEGTMLNGPCRWPGSAVR
ncbi:MAG: hypothetical protein ACYTG0_36175 [Planctomycetota bacterium]|jgi:hypothetical protein